MIDKFCISTYHNHIFDPTSPTADDLCMEDIAHALARICRANGHLREFYSVARHSLHAAYEAKERGFGVRVQLLALLHDSAESYIGDMTRPLRRHIPEFSEIERRLQTLIFAKFAVTDFTDSEKQAVKAIDDALLYHEFAKFHGIRLYDTPPELLLPVTADKPPAETEAEFLSLYRSLYGELTGACV